MEKILADLLTLSPIAGAIIIVIKIFMSYIEKRDLESRKREEALESILQENNKLNGQLILLLTEVRERLEFKNFRT